MVPEGKTSALEIRSPEAMLLKVFPNIGPSQSQVPLFQRVHPLNQQPQGMRDSNLIAESLPFLLQIVSNPESTPRSMDQGDLNRMPKPE